MSSPALQAHLWLRDETKPFERRTALTPANVAKLLAAGFEVTIERSTVRCFPDEDYIAVVPPCSPAALG